MFPIFLKSYQVLSCSAFRQTKVYHSRKLGAQIRGLGGDVPCPFLKIEKIALILGKKALIMSIFGLQFPFQMKF